MQRHGQTHRNTLSRKFFNTRYHADRGDGNVTCRNTETLGRHGTDLTNSAQYRLIVAHGLSHAHEYNVAQTSGATRNFSVTHGFRGHTDLFHNLACRHVSSQTQLARSAEGASHAATDLTGDAQRGACGIAHEHGLNKRTVEQAPQRFDSGTLISHLTSHFGNERREKHLRGLDSFRCWEVGEFLRIDIEMPVIMIGKLLDPEFRKSKILGFSDTLFLGHIRKMQRRLASTRMIFG